MESTTHATVNADHVRQIPQISQFQSSSESVVSFLLTDECMCKQEAHIFLVTCNQGPSFGLPEHHLFSQNKKENADTSQRLGSFLTNDNKGYSANSMSVA